MGCRWLLDIGYIFFYEAACAVFLPTPSEAPMFLFPDLSRTTVVLPCALGKGTGSYIVFLTGDRFRRSRFFARTLKLLRLDGLFSRLLAISENVMATYGYLGFLFVLSIPAMPMRSAIYSVSLLRIDALKFALGAAIGTIPRNLLVWGGYRLLKGLLLLTK